MSEAKHRWAEELNDSFEVLKTMRDELKVQMHLAPRSEGRTHQEQQAPRAQPVGQAQQPRLMVRRSTDPWLGLTPFLHGQEAR